LEKGSETTGAESDREVAAELKPSSEPPEQSPKIAPFHLNTQQTFAHMRVEGTPHNWPDAQAAWDEGRITAWPKAKGEHAMGYYRAEDIPFQFALADAFTICDGYHQAIMAPTSPNRMYLWTGTSSGFITNPDDYLPVHNFVLVVFGMNLFDDCDLDRLAEAAAARNRWEFLLTASPLPMPKGTGSPINPIAIF